MGCVTTAGMKGETTALVGGEITAWVKGETTAGRGDGGVWNKKRLKGLPGTSGKGSWGLYYQ